MLCRVLKKKYSNTCNSGGNIKCCVGSLLCSVTDGGDWLLAFSVDSDCRQNPRPHGQSYN